jgi:two-component system KDP operon response regulator KdpE
MVKAEPQILVAEADETLRQLLIDTLIAQSYGVNAALNDLDALSAVQAAEKVDIVLLDLALPLEGGWRILESLHAATITGVVVMSTSGAVTEKIRALDLGADVYLAKPFTLDELLAHVRALLRRMQPPPEGSQGTIRLGPVRVDIAARAVTVNGKEVVLSPKEWLLLAELARNAGRTVDPVTLLQRVWGPSHGQDRNYLRTFVQRLRTKLEEDATNPHIIVTVGQFGYRFGPLSMSARRKRVG